jgi:hypothetical protein
VKGAKESFGEGIVPPPLFVAHPLAEFPDVVQQRR